MKTATARQKVVGTSVKANKSASSQQLSSASHTLQPLFLLICLSLMFSGISSELEMGFGLYAAPKVGFAQSSSQDLKYPAAVGESIEEVQRPGMCSCSEGSGS